MEELRADAAGGGGSSASAGPRPGLRRSLAAAALPAVAGGGGSPAGSQQLLLSSRLEEEFGVDSWNLREKPHPNARVVAALRAGQVINVVGTSTDGEWLEIAWPMSDGRLGHAFAARYYATDTRQGGNERLEAFTPAGAPELRGAAAEPSGADGAGLSATDRAQCLLQEFVALRERYKRLPAGAAARDDRERARLARRIEDVISRLEFLGFPEDEVLGREDPMTLLLLLRGRSFSHRDFANPEAETCWLSCLFQSLWHSVVFHAAFELYLAPSKCTPGPSERILAALQRTWVCYAGEGGAGVSSGHGGEDVDEEIVPRLVPTEDLAEAFGEGYGDMSEALASIQSELADSSNPAAKAVAELIVLIPLSTMGDVWPTPAMAWKQVEEWKVTEAPLIAVDLSSPELTQASNRTLALLWSPGCREGDGAPAGPRPRPQEGSDLGPGHRLVALVCYYWRFRHYVAFCRRQRAPGRCLFFNDLPGLTTGAPRELEWKEVPETCNRYRLTPRLALYESLDAAEEVIRRRLSGASASTPAAGAGAGGPTEGTPLLPRPRLHQNSGAASGDEPRQEPSCAHQ